MCFFNKEDRLDKIQLEQLLELEGQIKMNDRRKLQVMFYFLSPNFLLLLFFLNRQIKCLIFSQKFRVVYLVIK